MARATRLARWLALCQDPIFVAEEKSQCVKYLIQVFEKFGIFQVDFNHLIFNINNKFQ
jgi:hypothetical protein